MSPSEQSAQLPETLPGDVHTHIWAPGHVSEEFMADLLRAWPEATSLDAGYESHAAEMRAVRRSVVLAFDAEHAGLVVPDDYVAGYVAQDPARRVGFCSIDPRRPDATERLRRAVGELGLRGVKIAPTYQGFDPLSPEAMRLYEEIAARGLPTLWHQGTTFVRKAVLAYARPITIDEVALRFPDMPIVIAHMGHPWVDECIAVVRKHPNVYADVSALLARPLQFRAALVSAGEYRCTEKLLLGSDWPFSRITDTARTLLAWSADETLPEAAREAARALVARDPLAAIGL